MPQAPLIQLRSGEQVVAGESQLPARFQAPAGVYLVRLQFLSNQSFDIPDVAIVAGETTRKAVAVPCGRVTVTVSGAGGRFPTVEVQKDGKFVTALSDNPARFLLLAGEYTVSIREADKLVGTKKVSLEAGQDLTVELNP